MVYPAALEDAVAVAALAGDGLAGFSNYGSNLVDLGAPGNGVISAYPGGLYGAGWGTSFSAPLVAGTAALLVHRYPARSTASVQSIKNALRHGSERIDGLVSLIGSGRLDVLGTVREAP
jgi:subtilisin family serine protease